MNKSIKTKILSRMLWISLVSIITLSVAAFIQMNSMGNKVATDSSAALAKVGQEQLLIEARSRAAMSNEKLTQFQNNAIMVRDIAQDIYRYPENYAARTPFSAKAENEGKIVVQQFFDKSYVETPAIVEETHLLANLQDVLQEIARTTPAIGEGSIYIATETGVIFMADKQSGQHAGDFRYDNVHTRPWYTHAKETGEIGWTDVMTDKFGRGLGIVCSAPVYDERGELKAVVGVGAMLTDLNTIVNTALGETGYSFILNQEGNVVFSAREGELAVSKLGTDAQGQTTQETLLDSPNAEIRSLAEKMLSRQTAINTLTVDETAVFAANAPIDTLGWSFATIITQEEVLRSAHAMEQQISQSTMRTLWLLMAIAVLLIVAAVFSGRVMARNISKPITVLREAAKKISEGKLDHHVDIHTGDELETLGYAFNKMTTDLLEHMFDLKRVTAEKERIGAELDVANHIQASMLPSIFPAFPERPELDIYATMTPAKEVGGDFYDFFLIDDDHLGIVMADVSGKGIPAALFMVIAKTLLKNVAQTGLSPKAVLEKVNKQLCVGNDMEMFVTVWLGILEISTGKLICANAGHEYPVLKRADDGYELLKDKHGFVLAGMEHSRYSEYELQLQLGDRIFLYTDGVAEATNADNEFYGTDRMLAALNRTKDGDCQQLLSAVKEDVDAFVGQAPQFDDITMLSLTLMPADTFGMQKLKLPPALEAMEKVTAFVEQSMEAVGLPMKLIAQMNIAVDEIFSNIACYSGATDATVGVKVSNGCLTLRFADNGLPYDPTTKAEPDITLSAEDREIGGLGLLMVKKFMDTVEYEYHDGLNILTLKKQTNAL